MNIFNLFFDSLQLIIDLVYQNEFWYLKVPNLYDGGDLGAICEGVRPRAKRAKRDGSRMELFAFFVDECAKNLRIALVCNSINFQKQ